MGVSENGPPKSFHDKSSPGLVGGMIFLTRINLSESLDGFYFFMDNFVS